MDVLYFNFRLIRSRFFKKKQSPLFVICGKQYFASKEKSYSFIDDYFDNDREDEIALLQNAIDEQQRRGKMKQQSPVKLDFQSKITQYLSNLKSTTSTRKKSVLFDELVEQFQMIKKKNMQLLEQVNKFKDQQTRTNLELCNLRNKIEEKDHQIFKKDVKFKSFEKEKEEEIWVLERAIEDYKEKIAICEQENKIKSEIISELERNTKQKRKENIQHNGYESISINISQKSFAEQSLIRDEPEPKTNHQILSSLLWWIKNLEQQIMEISRRKKMSEQIYSNIGKIMDKIKKEAQISEKIDKKLNIYPDVYNKSVEGKKVDYSSYSEYQQKQMKKVLSEMEKDNKRLAEQKTRIQKQFKELKKAVCYIYKDKNLRKIIEQSLSSSFMVDRDPIPPYQHHQNVQNKPNESYSYFLKLFQKQELIEKELQAEFNYYKKQ